MSSFAVSVRTVFFECPLRWFRRPAGASLSRWSSSSALRTRSASAFFSSSKSPSLLKTSFGSRPSRSWSRVSFLIAISALRRRHYGPAHKIPDSPWPSASASLTTSARSARSSSSSASRTSARVRAIRPRTRRPWRLLKKLRRDAEHSPRRPAEGQADRDLVPGRSPHRPEERPRAAVGAARLAPTPARRSALRKRLPVRRHLPGARHRRGARHALRRQRGDATPPRRGLEPCPPRRPRRAPPRSGRLAYDPSLGRAEEHHPRLPALARPRAQSGREHLAVPAPELALEPRVRNLRSDHRSGLRGLA